MFRALADPSRRLLLDHLFERDGQSITALGADLAMSRFGVAKHLNLLDDAGLVSTRKIGRERLHYLNPVPIQQIHQRWVSKYAEPWARVMSGLKSELEEPMTKPKHVYHVFIRTSPEKLWAALTEGELTSRYFYGGSINSDWTPGAPYSIVNSDGQTLIDGDVVDVEPPRRLVQTFRFPNRTDGHSMLTWEIEQHGESCRLTLVHEFKATDSTYQSVDDPMGWQYILSGLKTLLETDRPLVVRP